MARLPRLSVAGELHLVLLRGHNGGAVFLGDDDREAFLASLREACSQHGVALHAYVLLASEVRLLLTPGAAEGLSKAMQALGRRYVAGFNRRHGRSGTLWEGRFRAAVLESERYFLTALVHVETAPVAAGLAAEPTAWRWSSAPHHAGMGRDPLVTAHSRYWALGNTPFEREHAYRKALEAGPDSADAQVIEDASARSWAAGSPSFITRIAAETARPLQRRPRGRPRKNA